MPQADDGAPADAAAAGELWYKPYTLGELYDVRPSTHKTGTLIQRCSCDTFSAAFFDT